MQALVCASYQKGDAGFSNAQQKVESLPIHRSTCLLEKKKKTIKSVKTYVKNP